MEIYIDVFFLTNLIFNFFILVIVNIILKKRRKVGSLLFGSFVSTSLLIVAVYYEMIFGFNFFLFEILLIVAILVAFMPKIKQDFLKQFYLTNILTFCFGGVVIGISFISDFSTLYNVFDWKIFIVSSVLSYVVVKILIEIVLKAKNLKYTKGKVTFHMNDKKIICDGLLDTGNTLFYEGLPVNIINIKNLKGALNRDEIDNFFNMTTYEFIYHYKSYNLVAVPYRALGTKEGIILGVVCDDFEFEGKNIGKCIVGISDSIGNNQCIVNSMYIE